MPGVDELSVQEAGTVAFAVRLTAVAGQVTVKPVRGITPVEVRVVLPAKSKMLVRLTDIAAPAAPELKFTGVPTLMVKSPT